MRWLLPAATAVTVWLLGPDPAGAQTEDDTTTDDPVGGLLGDVADTVSQITDPVLEPLAPVTDPLLEPLAPVLEPLAPVTEPLEPVTGPLLPSTDSGAAPPAPSVPPPEPEPNATVLTPGPEATQLAPPPTEVSAPAPPPADPQTGTQPPLPPPQPPPVPVVRPVPRQLDVTPRWFDETLTVRGGPNAVKVDTGTDAAIGASRHEFCPPYRLSGPERRPWGRCWPWPPCHCSDGHQPATWHTTTPGGADPRAPPTTPD